MKNPISTRKEYKTVKTTEKVETYKTKEIDVEYKTCDSCDQDWDINGDIDVYTFHKNPRARQSVNSYRDLNEFIHSGFSMIDQVQAENDMYDLGIPYEKSIHHVIGKEQREQSRANGSYGPVGQKLEEIHNRNPDSILDRKSATLYMFIYEMDLPVKSTETKNLCEFCYEGIFG